MVTASKNPTPSYACLVLFFFFSADITLGTLGAVYPGDRDGFPLWIVTCNLWVKDLDTTHCPLLGAAVRAEILFIECVITEE